MSEPLIVGDAGSKGRGVFAAQAISAGSLVAKIGGRLCHTADIPDGYDAVQVGDDDWLCSDGTRIDDLINHSCDANVGFLTGEPELYAIRNIAAGEEICWDYSTSINETGWRMECECGSHKCRSAVLPFSELSPVDQERLLPITLRYLRDSVITLTSKSPTSRTKPAAC
ncbi:MAG TPA: SET domain-containing protein [Gemmatimonadaceae bacterium]|nr:SET domain-containing protein [Gemmatimonadaceae bacterium]